MRLPACILVLDALISDVMVVLRIRQGIKQHLYSLNVLVLLMADSFWCRIKQCRLHSTATSWQHQHGDQRLQHFRVKVHDLSVFPHLVVQWHFFCVPAHVAHTIGVRDPRVERYGVQLIAEEGECLAVRNHGVAGHRSGQVVIPEVLCVCERNKKVGQQELMNRMVQLLFELCTPVTIVCILQGE